MDDLVVVVNEKDEVVGTMPKAEAHANGTPHRIAVTYVGDGAGKFLVQVRMNDRLDHSSAGHVHPGESYEDAAKRELAEELGITGVTLQKIGHGIARNEVTDTGNRTHVFDVFYCEAVPGELQADEVKEAYWADPQEVFADMANDPDGKKYAGGFKASLPILIAYLAKV